MSQNIKYEIGPTDTSGRVRGSLNSLSSPFIEGLDAINSDAAFIKQYEGFAIPDLIKIVPITCICPRNFYCSVFIIRTGDSANFCKVFATGHSVDLVVSGADGDAVKFQFDNQL